MNAFRAVFAYEFKSRIRRRDIIIFLLLAAIFLIFAQYGKTRYLTAVDNIKVFQEAENTKVSKFSLYRQYAAFGLQLLFVPAPFCIIYNDYIFDELISSINTAEKLSISKSFKGKEYFTARTAFLTFGGMILIFGVFLSLLYGYDTTRSRGYLKLLSDISGSRNVLYLIIVSRIIILNLAFLVLYAMALLSLLIGDINLFQRPFMFLVIMLFILLTVFFMGGCVIGVLKRSIRGVIFGAVFFLSVVLIPFLADIGNEINAGGIDNLLKFDLSNLKIIMQKERELINKYGSLKGTDPVNPAIVKEMKEAVKNEHGLIKKKESHMRGQMLKKIKQSQTAAAFFPVLLYISTYKEISSQGGKSFIEFYSFGQQRKREFIDFYISKRFPENSRKINPDKIGPVENFVKNDENLFYAENHLPDNFVLGVCMSLLYMIVLLIILNLILKQQKGVIEKPFIDFARGKSLFVLCENEEIKGTISSYYQAQKNVSYIDKVIDDFNFSGTRAKLFLRLSCKLAGANEMEVSKKLRIMGIANIETQAISNEVILKIYVAVKVSKRDVESVIINDFFKQKSRQLEKDVKVLLESFLKDGITIVYLSCDYFNMPESLPEMISVKNSATIELPLSRVTLR